MPKGSACTWLEPLMYNNLQQTCINISERRQRCYRRSFAPAVYSPVSRCKLKKLAEKKVFSLQYLKMTCFHLATPPLTPLTLLERNITLIGAWGP